MLATLYTKRLQYVDGQDAISTAAQNPLLIGDWNKKTNVQLKIKWNNGKSYFCPERNPIYTRHDFVMKWTRRDFLCAWGNSKFPFRHFLMDICFSFWNLTCIDLEAFVLWHEPEMEDFCTEMYMTIFKIWHRYACTQKYNQLLNFLVNTKKLHLGHIMLTSWSI